jgi:hypothetical protein
LRAALHATKASGQPDWAARLSAVRALAALPPEEVEPEAAHPALDSVDHPPFREISFIERDEPFTTQRPSGSAPDKHRYHMAPPALGGECGRERHVRWREKRSVGNAG